MPIDYQQQIKEIFGTSDLDELRKHAKMLKINHPNPRNAGRKAQLTPDQTVEVLELHRKGIGNTEIAKQFGVSRQTIYKYIYNAEHFSTDPDFTMRMNFMNGQQLCTVIDIDFKHEVVRMKNYTDRIPLRAFGVVENPYGIYRNSVPLNSLGTLFLSLHNRLVTICHQLMYDC